MAWKSGCEYIMKTIRDRIEELRNIKAGWMDGEGEAVTPEAISELEKIAGGWWFKYHGIFPSLDGGILIEVPSFDIKITAAGVSYALRFGY